MERLNRIAGHVTGTSSQGKNLLEVNPVAFAGPGPANFSQCQTAAEFPEATHDALGISDLLTPSERAARDKVRAFMEREVAPVITDYWEKAEFPHSLVPKIAQLGIGGLSCQEEGSVGLSVLGAAMVVVEMARVDTSLSTFVMVHASLAMLTIEMLGSDKQKQELLPAMSRLDLIGCWALTEPSNGSDASGLISSARKVPGGWILNGRKRWIGNAPFADIVVVWARNLETNEINAFIIRKGTPGFRATKIENKISLRCVQNGDIVMEEVFVPDSDRLPGVNSFRDTSDVLAVSRIMVAWQPVGMAMGVYDMCLRYLKQRKQFGTPLVSFQLAQEKLVRMLGNIQGMFLMAWRLTKLHEAGSMSHGQASLVKAWNTLRGREVVSLGRELLGGNGVVSDFHVAKVFCDMEAIYSYEGTYDVNVLVAGREATGVAAIRAARK
ncbi:hypothetical protein BSKO_05163 [Bryopsis sp. KO-2023]|nr:hypothetical protein BSKO_05163 [Bryopsis sp. KO-2023]